MIFSAERVSQVERMNMNSREIYILEDDVAVRATLSVILAKAGYRAFFSQTEMRLWRAPGNNIRSVFFLSLIFRDNLAWIY